MPPTTALDRFSLEGTVAIVTGASSGLGVAFTKALAEAGADLVLAARRADRLEHTREVVEERGRRALAVTADVSRPEDAQSVVDVAIAEFGHVDVLVKRRQGLRRAGDPRDARAVPRGHRHQRQRVRPDGSGCGRTMRSDSAIVNVASVAVLVSGGLPQAAHRRARPA